MAGHSFPPLNPLRAALVSWLIVLLWVGSAVAQDRVKPDKTQIGLIDKAMSAGQAGEYDRAAQLFKAALLVQDLNFLHLNLGRALQKSGACQEAEAEFAKALQAPKVAKPFPAPDKIKAKVTEYRNELHDTCPATLTVQCTPPTLTLTVDDVARECGTPFELAPGKHLLKGTSPKKVVEKQVTVSGLQALEVAIDVSLAQGSTGITPPTENNGQGEEKPGMSGENTTSGVTMAGWALVGTGSVALITGAVFTLFVNQTNAEIEDIAKGGIENIGEARTANDLVAQADSEELVQYLSYGLGSAMIIGGAVILLGSDDSDEDSVVWSPWLGSDTTGMVMNLSW